MLGRGRKHNAQVAVPKGIRSFTIIILPLGSASCFISKKVHPAQGGREQGHDHVFRPHRYVLSGAANAIYSADDSAPYSHITPTSSNGGKGLHILALYDFVIGRDCSFNVQVQL